MSPHCFSLRVFGGTVIPLTSGEGQLPKAENKQPKKLSKSLLIYFEEVLHHKLIKSSIPG